MKKEIFTIFDSKANSYLQPFFLDTNEVAIRAIVDCLEDQNHNFARHPSDYTLFNIGSFDNQTAKITHSPRTTLGCLVEFIPMTTMVSQESQPIGDFIV